MDTQLERRRQDERSTISEQAAAWLLELESADPRTEDAFRQWIAESPLHVEAFLWASSVEQLLENIDPKREIDIAFPISGYPEHNVVTFESSRLESETRQPRLRSRWHWATAAAILIVSTSLWWGTAHFLGGHRYSTAVGEQRSVQLPDGSKVYLNTGTRLEFQVSAHARDVSLLAGEALFDVRHDAVRPFRVRSEGAIIQAVGTQFNVYRHPTNTTVTVVEGKVRISSENPAMANMLVAGEQANVSSAGKILRHAGADAAKATAWRQRRLVFANDTLGDMAIEFNRYNKTPLIVVEGESARARRYAAGFDADDPESLALFLAKDPTLEVERKSDALIIRARPASN